MTELCDYSGQFKSDLRYEDFSKEALIRLLTSMPGYYRQIKGIRTRSSEIDTVMKRLWLV